MKFTVLLSALIAVGSAGSFVSAQSYYAPNADIRRPPTNDISGRTGRSQASGWEYQREEKLVKQSSKTLKPTLPQSEFYSTRSSDKSQLSIPSLAIQ